MAISGSQKAYRFARAGIARSGTTRSNYIRPNITAILTHWTDEGFEVLDLSEWIQYGTLTISQATNGEANGCAMTLIPERDGGRLIPIVPDVGDQIAIGFASEMTPGGLRAAPGAIEFAGTVAIKQHTRRYGNRSPWIALTLQDWLWQFDARFVSYIFPRQSASMTIYQIVDYFVNTHEVPSGGPLFGIAFVEPNLPVVEGFAVEMWRPSTVLRRIMTAIGGGFYIDANKQIHAWSASNSYSTTARPQPLTNNLPSLKAFQHTVDATQIRHRVIVEGQRTTTLYGMPTSAAFANLLAEGLPVEDATLLNPPDATGPAKRARLGSQWVGVRLAHQPTPADQNSPGARVVSDTPVGSMALLADAYPYDPAQVTRGWLKVGDQFLFYSAVVFDGTNYSLEINHGTIGRQVSEVKEGDSVSWPDYTDHIFGFLYPSANNATGTSTQLREQPNDTPLIIYALADANQLPTDRWPHMEALVQDGRYGYAGAQQRADADLAEFLNPLVTAHWETDDRNAQAGSLQVINLTGVDPISATVTILSVSITFTMRHHAPRRVCSGGHVKQSTLLDIMLTSQA